LAARSGRKFDLSAGKNCEKLNQESSNMKTNIWLMGGLAAVGLVFTGCESIPPGAERGPNGTMAYEVMVESSEPGVKVQVNGEVVGNTPLTLKIFGDPDGTFHDFGDFYYTVQALPVRTNQFVQTASFRTGHMLSGEDRIPRRIYFDMNQPPPAYGPSAGPGYGAPPPVYYGGPPVYVGPRIYFGPPVYWGHRHRYY
jgi:hypothetical protein